MVMTIAVMLYESFSDNHTLVERLEWARLVNKHKRTIEQLETFVDEPPLNGDCPAQGVRYRYTFEDGSKLVINTGSKVTNAEPFVILDDAHSS